MKSYIEWLCDRVNLDLNRYHHLAATLYSTPFKWSGDIPTDENRAADGKALRYAYEEETGQQSSNNDRYCNVLEMLVALSERIDDVIGEPGCSDYSKWFWIMLYNLNLEEEEDSNYQHPYVTNILEAWLDKEYDSNGVGGLFPLTSAYVYVDQRDLSIWDQMSCFMEKNNYY